MVTVVPGPGNGIPGTGRSNVGIQQLLVPSTFAWHDINSVYVNIGGTWKAVVSGYGNVNGTWRLLDLGAPSYTFNFSTSKISMSTNGYVSFDNDNTTYTISKSLGRLLGVLPADLYLNKVSYLASTSYFIVRFSGRRITSATADEIQYEIWFPDASNFAYVWLQKFPSGTYDSTGFYKNGTVYGRVTTTRTVGQVYKVYFSNAPASLYATSTTWGLGATNAGLLDVTGNFSAYDDGFYNFNTAKEGNPTAVLNLAAASVGRTGTTVSWTLPSDPGQSAIQNYDWALSSDDGVTYGTSANVTTTSITLGTLVKDTKYRVRVRPYNFYSDVGPWAETATFSYTAPGDFTYQAADGTDVPAAPTITEYRGSNTNSTWGNESIIEIASSFPTSPLVTGYYLAAWGGAFSTTATSEASPAASATVALLNGFPQSDGSDASGTSGGDYSFTIKATTAAYGYVRATAQNVGNKKVTLSWTSSTGAKSYKVGYTISGAGALNGTYSNNVTGPNPNTYLTVTLGANAGTVTLNSVTAYDTTDCSGTNTTAGTRYYNPISQTFGANAITPTDKSTAGTTLTVGTYKIRYFPSVTLSAPTGLTSSAGTVNWTGSNIASWSITGDLSASSTTTGTTKAFTGLAASTTYNYTVTVTSSDSHTASATADATTNSTYRLVTKAAATAVGTPSVTGDNSLAIGGTFSWTCTGNPAAVYRVTIGYNFSSITGPFTTKYQQPAAALTTANGLSITSIRPGYDIGTGWAGSGYYRCTIQAINSATTTATTGSIVTYMS